MHLTQAFTSTDCSITQSIIKARHTHINTYRSVYRCNGTVNTDSTTHLYPPSDKAQSMSWISWERHRVYSVVVHIPLQCTLNNTCKCDNTGSHYTVALYTERTGMAECLRSWAQCPWLACSSTILLCHRSQRSIVGSLKARQTGAGSNACQCNTRGSKAEPPQTRTGCIRVSCKQIITQQPCFINQVRRFIISLNVG